MGLHQNKLPIRKEIEKEQKEMRKYTGFASLGKDALCDTIQKEYENNPKLKDIIFIAQKYHLEYNGYKSEEEPIIEGGWKFVNVLKQKDIYLELYSHLRNIESSPKRIRVIKPNEKKDSYGVFIRDS